MDACLDSWFLPDDESDLGPADTWRDRSQVLVDIGPRGRVWHKNGEFVDLDAVCGVLVNA